MCAIKKMQLAELHDALAREIDVFICASSFESRCLSIPLLIEPRRVRDALVIESDKVLKAAADNTELLVEHFGDIATRARTYLGSPLDSARAMDSAICRLANEDSPCKNVVLDVTTFTREGLLIMLRLLQRRLPSDCCYTLAYNAALQYANGKSGGSPNWLSKGVREVRSVLSYPGELLPSRKTHLVVMVGFEFERSCALVNSFEAHRLSLGCGAAGTETGGWHFQENKRQFDALEDIYENVDKFVFPTNSPNEAADAIRQQIDKYPNHNVVIAPMNNKLSTIGAGIVAMRDDTIQLVYAEAILYNYASYSEPSQDCYVFDLPELRRGNHGLATE